MVKVIVQKQEVDSSEMIYANQIENSFESFVKDTLNRKKELQIKVCPKFEIIKREANPYRVEHNASFEMEGSYGFVSLVNDFFKSRDDWDVCFKKHTLLITLDMKPNDKSKSKTMETKKTDKTPDFIPVVPKYTFEQMILPENVSKDLFDALKVIECKELIYDKWGFSEIDSVPRSVLNFYGDPGTGKTMCAHAIAHRLGKKILLLNYAEIESKYVGEAPKNLMKAFTIAEQTDSVLFFDEADSFLGKRIQNVTQGSDQALNSLRSQMLILLEQFSGVVLFATNLVTNFDRAFESRILKHIRFELPNQQARCAIIKKMLPSRLPKTHNFTDEEIDKASSMIDGFSGREIKNAILDMMLSKAKVGDDSLVFEISDLFDAFAKKKEELKVLKEQEEKLLKDKILKKLHEKNEEARIENEAKQVDQPDVCEKTDERNEND